MFLRGSKLDEVIPSYSIHKRSLCILFFFSLRRVFCLQPAAEVMYMPPLSEASHRRSKEMLACRKGAPHHWEL